MRRPIWLLVSAALAGCGTESLRPNPPVPPPSFTVEPAMQWSGGDILVRSASFKGRSRLPEFRVGNVSAEGVPVDDSTVRVTLPVLPTQTADVLVIDQYSGYVAGTVEIRGLRTSSYPFSPPVNLIGQPVIFTSPDNRPVAVGSSPQGELAILELLSGVETASSSAQLLRSDLSVGVSFRPNRILVLDSLRQPTEWQLFPLSYVAPSGGTSSGRFTVQLNHSTWLEVFQHSATIRRTGQPDVAVQVEDGYRPLVSPAAGRAILNSPALAKVFSTATGDLAYTTGLTETQSAFSADGASLYLAGNDPASGLKVIQRLQASDGVVQGSVTLQGPDDAEVGIGAVAVNDGGNRVFLVGARAGRLVVWVYDATTLTRIGWLESNQALSCECRQYWDMTAYLDEQRSTFLVMEPGIPTHVWQFDLVP